MNQVFNSTDDRTNVIVFIVVISHLFGVTNIYILSCTLFHYIFPTFLQGSGKCSLLRFLAWGIPWMEEPGRLQFTEWQELDRT